MKNLIFILLFINSCTNDKRQFYHISTKTDTAIIVKRKIDNRTFMTLIVNGQLQNDCLITLLRDKNHNKNDRVTKREYVIKKGFVNDTLGIGDLYDNYAKIVFSHQNNKSGKLKFEILF